VGSAFVAMIPEQASAEVLKFVDGVSADNSMCPYQNMATSKKTSIFYGL